MACLAWPAAQSQTMAGAPAILPQTLVVEIKRLLRDSAISASDGSAQAARIEVLLGRIDPALKLAPCQKIEPYLPAGLRPLGRSRVGLRCVEGAKRWQISLPVTVQWWAQSLVASTALPAGTVLEARHLLQREVDLAERADPAIDSPDGALGRTLTRGLASGEALRGQDLKARHCFNAGDTVRIVAAGQGYSVSSEGLALGPGLEGQSARARTEGGRIVTGVAAGQRRIELTL